VKVICISTCALMVLFTASLFTSCETENVEEIEGQRAAIASLNLRNFLKNKAILMGNPLQAQEPPGKSNVTVPLPDGEGRDTVKKVCGTCHSTDIFARQRHSRDMWSSILDNMTSRGMNASDDDLDAVLNYLATNLGPEKKGDSAQLHSRHPDRSQLRQPISVLFFTPHFGGY
jgi:hypothetical protein